MANGLRARAVQVADEGLELQVDRRGQQVDLDPTAPAVAPAAHQRGQDAHGQQRRAVVVGGGDTDRARALLSAAGDRHQAGEGLDQQVLARALGVGPVRPVAGGGGVDQPRVVGLERLESEAQPVHDAGPEVLGEHVGARRQLARDLEARGRFEVEGQRTLVAVAGQEQHALPVDRLVGAAPVALKGAAQRLDRDHVGAQVGEQLNPHRAQKEVVEAEDPGAVQKVHGLFRFRFRIPGRDRRRGSGRKRPGSSTVMSASTK